MKRRLSDDDTRAFADEHLIYEIEMVAGLTRRLSNMRTLLESRSRSSNELADELFDLAGRNADIEAFGLHTRLLLDFFYRDKRIQHDAIAADFFGDDSWRQIRPEKTSGLEQIARRVGEEIAHLSYRRAARETAKTWSYGEIWRDLACVVCVFVDSAAPERLGSEFRERARAVLASASTVSQDRRVLSTATQYRLVAPALFSEDHGGTAIIPLPKPSPYFD
jgi:hypothetical protein